MAALRSLASSNMRRVVTGAPSVARSFSSSVVYQRDFVQELYLKELKSYQPAPQPKDAHVGQVREFSAPTAPQTPSVPTAQELASELSAWEQTEPVSEATTSSTAAAAAASGEESAQTADEFLSFLENRQPEGDQPSHH